MAGTITRETKVALGLILTVIGVGFASTWKVSAAVAKVEQRLAEVETDRYTLSAASEQALRTAMENPGLRVPDPRNPGQVFVVRDAASH